MLQNSNKNNDVIFQLLDWSNYHKENEEGDKKFTIRLFGMTEEKKNIFVEVTNFTPYFFVEIPDHWTEMQLRILIDVVRNKINKQYQNNFIKVSIVERYKFWGFTDNKLFKFARLIFHDYETYQKYRWIFEEQYINILRLNINQKFKIYESNIEPMLRCMHTRNLQSCGWVKIKCENYKNIPLDEIDTSCDINITTKFSSLEAIEGRNSDIQPFTIAAFDIECVSENGSFPQPQRSGDKIIMIATTFSRFGENTCYYKNVIVLGSCNPIEDAEVISCKNEKELLIEWSKIIRKHDPDFITGWNIFGFDEIYIYERCKLLNILPQVSRLSRVKNEFSEFKIKKLASSALGDNELKYFDTIGRVHFDLMKVVQKDYKLASYKLDFVASSFFREIITEFEKIGNNTLIKTKGVYGIKEGQYTTIVHNDGVTDYEHLNGKKFKILEIKQNTILLEGDIKFESLIQYLSSTKYKVFWCQVKDDVKPKEIFEKFNGSTEDRTDLALYNIQDCELCNKLTAKLQIIVNNISMANVCSVPVSYLFMRGQGIKVFSLVSKKCREKQYVIPVIKKKKLTEQDNKHWNKQFSGVNNSINQANVIGDVDQEDTGFEGAIVFEPTPGLYLNPIFVLDYASLYPNSMRLKNLSHECIVLDDKYKNLPNYYYNVITYNNNDEEKTPAPPCIFAKNKNGTPGILPEILEDLLNARSATRKLIEKEKDPFKQKVLDGLQLAYKMTANSLYGQTGAPTSSIFMKEIAACTTATGRDMLKYSKTFVENLFGDMINYAIDDKESYNELLYQAFEFVEHFEYTPDEKKFMSVFDDCSKEKPCPRHGLRSLCKLDSKHLQISIKKNKTINWKKAYIQSLRIKIINFMKGFHIKPKVIYGDTDSVFVDPHIICDETKKLQTDKQSLEKAITLGVIASMVIGTLLPFPMKQEYEKTLYPLILISKKRYVGNLYETSITRYYQKSMGIVLKRRDNAQIVKIVCGGIVDKLLNEQNPKGAVEFTKKTLSDIFNNKYSIDKFVITKTLKETYKNRKQIAHAVLADRMSERDQGNKPLPNDRIPYVYIVPKTQVQLQGERIETPDYVIQNNLKIDYVFYITNQIMKPAIQFLELFMEYPTQLFYNYVSNCDKKKITRQEEKKFKSKIENSSSKKSILDYY
jgi:DNA polymerase elongation subunit (family B)